ncbi:hypothetical protein [Tunturibacter empetritectus]|uniref:Uncharacterized protein n=1 Tax=Tunturiibacter lichenicola TaxID=2051959 RepID=A0A7W8N612_9BACT|nr:hypothetical protein [Edaphobacter lichenicola]MBB5346143.1 hypothetical protein [Edaphobacter lichenicola]
MVDDAGAWKLSWCAEDLIDLLATDMRAVASVGGRIMWDLGCVAASVLFFLIAIGYTTGCERLGMKEKLG